MLEQYLGTETFRKGVVHFLNKHAYDNAETGDLWDAIEESARQPARALMDSWIFQPGYPLITAPPPRPGPGGSPPRFSYPPRPPPRPARGPGLVWLLDSPPPPPPSPRPAPPPGRWSPPSFFPSPPGPSSRAVM